MVFKSEQNWVSLSDGEARSAAESFVGSNQGNSNKIQDGVCSSLSSDGSRGKFFFGGQDKKIGDFFSRRSQNAGQKCQINHSNPSKTPPV